MSVKRVYYVKSARQTYEKDSSTASTIPVLKKDGTPKLGRGGRPMTRRVAKPDHSRPKAMPKCGKCGTQINVGDPYRYWEPYFRSSYKAVRCMKNECTPRMSELESSQMSTVYAAQESVQDQIAGLSPDDAEESTFTDLAQEVIDALEEVIDAYREADESFGGQGATQSAERAEELESTKDELEGVSFDSKPERDEMDACDMAGEEDGHEEGNQEGCEDCQTIYQDAVQAWFDEQVSNLEEAMASF